MFVNLEYEIIVLGSILLYPKVIDDNLIHENLFYNQNNQRIFKMLIECIESGIKPDIIVLSEKLKDIPASYISAITSKAFSTANIEFYVNALDELSKKRKLYNLIQQCREEIKGKSAQEIIEKIEDGLTNLNDNKKKGYLPIKEFIPKAIERIEKKYHHNYTGIRIGYRDVDYLIEDLPEGTFNIIAARTGMGKTCTALNIAHNMLKQNKKVGFFSCEMSGDLLAERFIQKIAMVNTRKMYEVKENEFERMTDACNEIYGLPIFIDDTPNIYLYELKSKARKMKREGIDIIFIDYISLIKYQNEKLSLYEKYGAISKELKQLARELNIPIMALHQLNREAEGGVPSLDQLRNSGQLEEDADIIILMSGNRKDENMELVFDVAKNKFGAAGACKLLFKKKYQLITDIVYEAKK